MATRADRLAEFTVGAEPPPEAEVELLCEDHNGTYVLPFPCARTGQLWVNIRTREQVQVEVIGWRLWNGRRAG